MFSLTKILNKSNNKNIIYCIISCLKNKKLLENLEEDNYTWYNVLKKHLTYITYDNKKDFKKIYLWFHNINNPNIASVYILNSHLYDNDVDIIYNYDIPYKEFPITIHINCKIEKIFSKSELYKKIGKNKITKLILKDDLDPIYFYPYTNWKIKEFTTLWADRNKDYDKYNKIKILSREERKLLSDKEGSIILCTSNSYIIDDNNIKLFNKHVIEKYPINMWIHLSSHKRSQEVVFNDINNYLDEIENNLFIYEDSLTENIILTIYISYFIYNFVKFNIVAIILKLPEFPEDLEIFKQDCETLKIYNFYIPWCCNKTTVDYTMRYIIKNNSCFAIHKKNLSIRQKYFKKIRFFLKNIDIDKTLFLGNKEI